MFCSMIMHVWNEVLNLHIFAFHDGGCFCHGFMVYHYSPLQTNFCSKQMIDQNFTAEPGKKIVALF